MSAVDTIRSALLGNPLDPNKKPSRSGVVKAFTEMQLQLEAAQAGALVRSTKALLDALLEAPVSAMAWVINDATLANNGIYENTGTAEATVWTRRGSIPQFVISAINMGEGTANAIEADTDLPIPSEDGRALILLPIIADNTTSNPTVQFNEGDVLTIKSNSGQTIVAGGLVNGMILAGFISEGDFRLITNQVDAALVAAAEDAADRAEAAAASIDLPPLTAPDAGKILMVNAAGSLYELNFLTGIRFLDLNYGADKTGASNTAAAWNAAVDGGGLVIVPAGTYRIDSSIVVDNPVTFLFQQGVTVDINHNGNGFDVTADDVQFIGSGGSVFDGPRATTEFLDGSIGISFNGTSGAQVDRPKVKGLKFQNFKHGGIRFVFCNDAVAEENEITECTYMGCFFLSCVRSKFLRNRVTNIKPGFGGTSPKLGAYGVSFSQNSGGDRVCSEFDCIGNIIDEVPTWTGIDTHAGQNGMISNNRVTNCHICIGVTTDGGSRAPSLVSVIDNYVKSHPPAGVSINGGTVRASSGILLAGVQGGARTFGNVISRNKVYSCGYYDGSNWFPSISIQTCFSTKITENILEDCRDVGIGLYYINFGVEISSNEIHELMANGAAAPYAVWISSATNSIILSKNGYMIGTAAGTQYLYHVVAQSAGWAVRCSRDSYGQNITSKFSPGSSANVIDMGTAL